MHTTGTTIDDAKAVATRFGARADQAQMLADLASLRSIAREAGYQADYDTLTAAHTALLFHVASERGYEIERERKGRRACFVAVRQSDGERLCPTASIDGTMRLIQIDLLRSAQRA